MSRDEPTPVRDEDAFDVDALHAWLAARSTGLTGRPRCGSSAAAPRT
jgi:hypothetical protein